MSPYTTTLKKLRREGACVDGYNTLVRALQGLPYTDRDVCRQTYIRFKHLDKVPLSFILDSNGVEDTCWALQNSVPHDVFVAEYTGFSAWCVEQVKHILDAGKDAPGYGSARTIQSRLIYFPTWEYLEWQADLTGFATACYACGTERIAGSNEYAESRDCVEDMFRRMCEGTAPWQTAAQTQAAPTKEKAA